MLKDTKLEEYIELVDSQEATPGGGSRSFRSGIKSYACSLVFIKEKILRSK